MGSTCHFKYNINIHSKLLIQNQELSHHVVFIPRIINHPHNPAS